MKIAYLDTSCVVAIAFREPGSASLARIVAGMDEIVSSNLTEAEVRATFAREGASVETSLLASISWVYANRPLTEEIARVLTQGYIRGADCWHLANALFLSPDPGEIHFLTLDQRQKKVARALGFLP